MQKVLFIFLALSVLACGKKEEKQEAPAKKVEQAATEEEKAMEILPNGEPAHITVQHILVAFKGAPRIRGVERSKEQAQKLAFSIMMEAQQGEDFTELMRKYSSDTGPGIYKLANDGVEKWSGEYGRRDMVPAFGDVGFTLEVGEIKIAPYDPVKSPYGWHVIKRLK